ncbi:hypothetical protein [Rhodopirellula baltica]|nr:hypothetical protein [Rhodopirellula baltica]
MIDFNAFGHSTGVYFEDHLDDFCFRLILSGLHGTQKPESDVNPYLY